MKAYLALFLGIWMMYAPAVAWALPPHVFYRRTSPAAEEASIFTISEDAEGTGVPTGWTNGANPPNWDYTTTVIAGTQSVFFPATGTQAYAPIANSAYYVAIVRIRVPSILPTTTRVIMSFNNDANYILQARITSTGGLRVRTPVSDSAETTDKMAINTTYYVKLVWTDGGPCSAEFSTTSTFVGSGNKYRGVTGQSAQTINRFNIGASSNSIIDYVMDTIRVATTNFTL